MDAYPPVVTYTWHFNNSVEQSSGGSGREMALDHDRFTADGLVSTLEFSPTAGSSKGPSIHDVHKIFDIFDPPLSSCPQNLHCWVYLSFARL